MLRRLGDDRLEPRRSTAGRPGWAGSARTAAATDSHIAYRGYGRASARRWSAAWSGPGGWNGALNAGRRRSASISSTRLAAAGIILRQRQRRRRLAFRRLGAGHQQGLGRPDLGAEPQRGEHRRIGFGHRRRRILQILDDGPAAAALAGSTPRQASPSFERTSSRVLIVSWMNSSASASGDTGEQAKGEPDQQVEHQVGLERPARHFARGRRSTPATCRRRRPRRSPCSAGAARHRGRGWCPPRAAGCCTGCCGRAGRAPSPSVGRPAPGARFRRAAAAR